MSKPSRSDTRLFIRALRQGWNVPVRKRAKIVDALCAITNNETTTAREKTSAARALMHASRVELDAIRIAQLAILEDLFHRMDALEGNGGTNGQLQEAANAD